MAEYIEREALENELNRRLKFLISEYGEHDQYTSGFDDAIYMVGSFASADVAPVVHGKWIAEENESISKRNRLIKYKTYSCSICGRSNGRRMGKHCPNCGAKMDGEER